MEQGEVKPEVTAEELSRMIAFFAQASVTGEWSDRCLEAGFLPVRVHYYMPIPDLRDLEARAAWDRRSEMPGIDFEPGRQLALLAELGAGFGGECQWPCDPTADATVFHSENGSFTFGCAALTHCLIRHLRPRRVIEIGSGFSSRVIAGALGLNQAAGSRYVVIDPYPADGLDRLADEVIPQRVELIEPDFFAQLEADDILFIDSGHCVRIGGDVNHLVLEVLPRLAKGVTVHFHDISLPYEYPAVYYTNPAFRVFWTEQYLLQSFLCFNSHYEVLLAANYLQREHGDAFRKAFPHYDPRMHRNFSGSFWIRRRR